jgi:predicted nucleotidyltransferase
VSNHNEIARRRRLVKIVAPAYAANPKVAGVLLAGSVARGIADQFSDIEIDIYWHTPPTDEDRTAPIERAGWGIVYRHVDENEWADGILIEGVKVDTSQFLVSTIERYLDDALVRADIEPEYQVRITAIQHGRPLYGAELIERWRARVASYPEALAQAMLAEYCTFRPRYLLEMLAERDDVLLLHQDLVAAEQQILSVLMGVNRVYAPHPFHKWLDWEIGQLAIAPPDLNRRMRQILRAEPRAAVGQLHQLIEETFALIEQHLPSFDTSAARAVYEERRVVESTQPTIDDRRYPC